MKNAIYILALAGSLSACNSNQPATQANNQATVSTDLSGTNYKVDTDASIVNWEATKLKGAHNGTVRLSAGNFNIKEGNIVSGGFEMQMNSIADLDLTDAKSNSDLTNHLKSDAFFDAVKFPVGKFEITSSEILDNDPSGNTHKVSGNLSIKDSTKNISFPVKIALNDKSLEAGAEVIINRLQWGITYNSVSISPAALLKKLGDNAINDGVKIKITLKAVKE